FLVKYHGCWKPHISTCAVHLTSPSALRSQGNAKVMLGECAPRGRSCRPCCSPLVEGADGGREKQSAAAVGARFGIRAALEWQHGAGGDRRHRHRRAVFCPPGARTD